MTTDISSGAMSRSKSFAAATARPWRVEYGINGGYVISDEANGFGICQRSPWENRAEESRANAALIVRAVNRDHTFDAMKEALEGAQAERDRLLANAKADAWLLAGYHRICERHGVAPSSSELMAAAKEAEADG